jgi:beta-galactosidase GanA
MFVFGTQYLRGNTPYKDDWERDFAHMKKCGFNTVRAWIVWNAVQKNETEIDFDYLNEFLDTAGRHDIKVGFLFHLRGAPEWLTRKYPQYYYVNAKGRAFEPAVRANTPSGGWPGLCFDYPEVQKMEYEFIERVVKNLAHRKEIAFWEPMNEPHQWVDLDENPVDAFCYCPATRERFREWLKNKYGTIQALNFAWGRHHNDWDEVRPPTWRFGYTDHIDFRTFTIDNVAAEISRRAEVIRKYDSRPVIAHAWGGGTITCPNIGAMAFDDWKNAEVFDMWGYSAFPDSFRQNVMLGLGTDATRSAAGGKTIWQSELGAGDIGSGFERRGRVSPETITGWTWESLRHGAKGVLYWQYRKEKHGPEFAAFSLTDYAGGDTENLRAVTAINKVLQEHEDLFAHSHTESAEVALVFSMRTFLADWCDHRDSNMSIDSISGYYKMFWEENIPVDILHEDYMADSAVKQYKLIITPLPAALSQNAKDVLKRYVAQGGTLLSDPYFCPYTQHFHLDCEVPGGGFHEVFGCREDDIYACAESEDIIYKGEPLSIENGHFKETFKLAGGEPMAVYAPDSAPAIIENKYGDGKAIISGVNLGLSYSPRLGVGDDFIRNKAEKVHDSAKKIVMDIAQVHGISLSFRCDCGYIQGGFLINEDADDVLILINNSKKEHQVRFVIPGRYDDVENMLGDETSDFDRGLFSTAFKPLETKVYIARKKM